MAQRLLRDADIAHPAFQLGRIRKTAILLALPDLLTVDIDREDPAGPRHQRHRGDVGAESM